MSSNPSHESCDRLHDDHATKQSPSYEMSVADSDDGDKFADHDGESPNITVDASQDISGGGFASPLQCALLMVFVPLCWCIFPLLSMPLSGTFKSSSAEPSVNFYIYSLIWQPMYFYLSFWVVFSFFLFSTRRFENQKMYFFLSLISYGCSILYCVVKGSHGLHGDTDIALYSNLWTGGFVSIVELGAAIYWHFYCPTTSNPPRYETSASSDMTQVSSEEDVDVNMLSQPTFALTSQSREGGLLLCLLQDSHLSQYFLSLSSCLVLVVAFSFCQVILAEFNARPTIDAHTGVYLLFQAVMFFLRTVASQLAIFQCKRSPSASKDITSLFVFSQHCFFFVFYRSLFAHINSIGEFAFFQSLQLAFELLQYVILLQSDVFRIRHQLWRRAINSCYYKLHSCFNYCGLAADLSEEAVVEDLRQTSGPALEAAWNEAVSSKSKDFLVRLIAMTSTWTSYFAVSLIINLIPWVQPHFPTLAKKSGSSQFGAQQAYFVVSIACEWSVAAFIQWFLFKNRRRGESLWQMWAALSRNTEMLLFFIVIVAHIVQDMYVPSLCMNFNSQLPLPCAD